MPRFLPLVLVAAATGCHGSGVRPLTDSGTDAPFGPADAADATASAEAGSVLNIAVTPLALTPAFSPTIHDYYVRCPAGQSYVTVTMTAAAGGTVALRQPTTTKAAASGSATFPILANQAVVVSAAGGGSASAEYWIRCLPSNFPELSMDVHVPGAVTPGYYLLGDTGAARGHAAYAMVLDANGVPVWYSTTETGRGAANVESQAQNEISFVAWLNPTYLSTWGQYEVHDLSATSVTNAKSVGEPLNPHDMLQLPNGHFLLLTWPIITGVDLRGLASYGASEAVLSCNIQEVDENGVEVWSWAGMDHFNVVKDSTWPQNVAVSGTDVIDPFHCNSLDVNADGDILLSARHMDSVLLVSRATGKIIWKLGGAIDATQDDATYLNVVGDPLGTFYRQHDARFLPNGQVSMFDDETVRDNPARGVIYAYDVAARTATYVWQYKGVIPSGAMGSFRLTDDGSRVIGWGEGSTFGRVFTEVNESGLDLLDFYFVDGDYSYRAIKVPLSQLDLSLMHASVGAEVSTPDAGALDAHVADAGSGCSKTMGTGSDEVCSFTTGAACTADAGWTKGTCSSANLFGCCVVTTPADGGGSTTNAACYYSADDAGQNQESACELQAYEGNHDVWQSNAP